MKNIQARRDCAKILPFATSLNTRASSDALRLLIERYLLRVGAQWGHVGAWSHMKRHDADLLEHYSFKEKA
jgi:hypothetical protein